MQLKWKEMTQAQKTHQIISTILCVISAIFLLVDIFTDWKYADLGWCVSFAVYMISECIGTWNRNRRNAIIELVVSIALIVVSIITTFC